MGRDGETRTRQWKRATKIILEEDLKNYPESFYSHFKTESVQYLGDNSAAGNLVGELFPTVNIAVGFLVRVTLCCEKIDGSWLISHLHASTPNASPKKKLLEDALEERIKQKTLLDSIPGGIVMYRMKKDGRVPCEYISDGLGRVCGYSSGKEMLQELRIDARNVIVAEELPIF